MEPTQRINLTIICKDNTSRYTIFLTPFSLNMQAALKSFKHCLKRIFFNYENSIAIKSVTQKANQ